MYRCKKCNSTEVEEKAWVNMNTGQSNGLLDETDKTAWCCDCEEIVEFYNDELDKLNKNNENN